MIISGKWLPPQNVTLPTLRCWSTGRAASATTRWWRLATTGTRSCASSSTSSTISTCDCRGRAWRWSSSAATPNCSSASQRKNQNVESALWLGRTDGLRCECKNRCKNSHGDNSIPLGDLTITFPKWVNLSQGVRSHPIWAYSAAMPNCNSASQRKNPIKRVLWLGWTYSLRCEPRDPRHACTCDGSLQ